MNRCQKCNAELPAKVSFCAKCGFSQKEKVNSSRKSPGDQAEEPLLPTAALNGHVKIGDTQKRHRVWYKEPRFWITFVLLVCFIGGLGAYYISNPISGTTRVSSRASGDGQPVLSLQGPLNPTVKQGQTLVLHGEHFGANDPIAFLLDSSVPIKDKDNNVISIQASSMGRFDVAIPIHGSAWSADPHYIQATGNRSKREAYLNLVVDPASTPETTSPNLALSMQNDAVKTLIFHAVIGQGGPHQQSIALTNTSNLPLSWMATAKADHNLDWLAIGDNHIAGNLDQGATDSISISALITALKSNQPANPYTGQIVFTINASEQLILPVELQVTNAQPEVIFTPNPGVVALGAGNTCQTTTFTLINLGKAFISWTLVPYEPATKDHIHFLVRGQSITHGDLAISGDPGDSQVLDLQCSGVSSGSTYKFTIYSGSVSWPVTITIR